MWSGLQPFDIYDVIYGNVVVVLTKCSLVVYLVMQSLKLSVKTCVCVAHSYCLILPGFASCQVSETEREDLEESEKVQHWVERLCQTRLEQISCVENESPEVQRETSSVRISLHLELFNNVLF